MLRRLLGEDVHLTMNLDRALGSVRADAGSLHQVLMNLAVNARDAMPEGGDLTISTSNVVVDPGGPLASAIAPGDSVELTVADTGVGMSDDVRSHLFEPFFSTKEPGKGTGLGLSTVFGIVQQSGGGIVVETELGKGTTFRILLPRAPAEPVSDREEASETVTLHGTETILLVEDQQEVRKLAAGILTSLNYTVLIADAPERALELAQDRSRTIHLLLTDVIMPGMPGTELADLIRTYQAGIKVLFMSGYGEASHVSERISRPGFGFLQKPFTPESLAIKLREILGQR
jgi:CheY-like chemotaxis protein